jgi:hypothetical protein
MLWQSSVAHQRLALWLICRCLQYWISAMTLWEWYFLCALQWIYGQRAINVIVLQTFCLWRLSQHLTSRETQMSSVSKPSLDLFRDTAPMPAPVYTIKANRFEISLLTWFPLDLQTYQVCQVLGSETRPLTSRHTQIGHSNRTYTHYDTIHAKA